MNKERIEQTAASAYAEWVNCTCVGDCSERYSEIIGKYITQAVNEALEDAAIKLSRMEMDLPLDDYVDAIRRMKL